MINTVLQRMARLALPLRRLAQQPRLGQHRSHQSGSGLDFDRIKEYQIGEAIRKVNWFATARKGSLVPLVNVYNEDKAITVMLLVDLSASMDFGSHGVTKRVLAAEIGASIVYSALASHDRIGLLGFASEVLCYVPPQSSPAYQRLIPEYILSCQAGDAQLNLPAVGEYLGRGRKQSALVFLLSDFLTDDLAALHPPLQQLRHHHDLIALVVTDTLEKVLPLVRARVVIRDLETGCLKSYSFTRNNQLTCRYDAAQETWPCRRPFNVLEFLTSQSRQRAIMPNNSRISS